LQSPSPLCEMLMQPLIAAAGTVMDAQRCEVGYNDALTCMPLTR